MTQRLQDKHLFDLGRVLSSLRTKSQTSSGDLFHSASAVIVRVEHLQPGQVNKAEALLLAERFALRLDHLTRHLESAGNKLAEEHDGMPYSCDAERADCVREQGEEECNKILRVTVVNLDDVVNGPEDVLKLSVRTLGRFLISPLTPVADRGPVGQVSAPPRRTGTHHRN